MKIKNKLFDSTRKHDLLPTETGELFCRNCRWRWKRRPRSICPGVPRYGWGEWPDYLKTKNQIRQMKLKLPAAPSGAYYRSSKVGKPTQFMWLYDVAEAKKSTKGEEEK